jgi:hypothetical protein
VTGQGGANVLLDQTAATLAASTPFTEEGFKKILGGGRAMRIGRRGAGLLVAVLLSCGPALAATEYVTDFDFTRAMYGPWNMSELADVKFDAFYKHSDWTWEMLSPGRHERVMGPESIWAAEGNVTYIAGQYYHQPSWSAINFSYSHAVAPGASVEPLTPSPVDESWWMHMMEEPAVHLANLSLYYPIWGVVWDMELYGHGSYFQWQYSYDDAAIAAFMNATNESVPSLPPSQRYFWFRNAGLLEEYQAWQEDTVYSLAKATEQKVHAINPSFALGILGFEDCWFHWTILEAFNSSTAPVTAWWEKTYAGYRIYHKGNRGEEGVELLQNLWREHGLNGKFIPGLRASVTNIEAAIRHNGALWIYQYNGHPFQTHGDELKERYTRMYQAIDHFLFFNTSDADPLPIFNLLPGVEARPYLAPDGSTSVLLKPHGDSVPTNFTIVTDSPQLQYMLYTDNQVATDDCYIELISGPNLTLAPDDLPCILYGLTERDLLATEVWALLQELKELIPLYHSAGIGEPPSARQSLELSLQDFRAGRYEDARSRILAARDGWYSFGMDEIWPLVEDGFDDPRESQIPLPLLRTFSAAKSKFAEDKPRDAEVLLIEGLRGFSTHVGEPVAASLLIAALGCLIGVARDRGKPT